MRLLIYKKASNCKATDKFDNYWNLHNPSLPCLYVICVWVYLVLRLSLLRNTVWFWDWPTWFDFPALQHIHIRMKMMISGELHVPESMSFHKWMNYVSHFSLVLLLWSIYCCILRFCCSICIFDTFLKHNCLCINKCYCSCVKLLITYHTKEENTTTDIIVFIFFYFYKNSHQASWVMSSGVSSWTGCWIVVLLAIDR